MNFVEAGRVVDTSIYPVKGMRGIALEELKLSSVSIAGDRMRAFTMLDAERGNTLLDTTKFPGLLLYSPGLVTPDDPKRSLVDVTTPNGEVVSADSEELLDEIEEASGRQLAMLRMGRGAYHSMPVSLMSMASIDAIQSIVGFSLDPQRFRENILVETTSGEPFVEDSWIGKTLRFGDRQDSAQIQAYKLDGRCETVNIHPDTARRRGEVLGTINRERQNNLGIYATIVFDGTILRGDTLYTSEE